MAESKWIKGAVKRPGAFTAKAKAHKMGVQDFATKVIASPEKYAVRTRKQAVLARTLKSLSK
jgi:hypothetical protein